MSNARPGVAYLFVILLLVTAVIPHAGAASVPKATRIFLYHYSFGYGGRITDMAGNPVPLVDIFLYKKIIKNGVRELRFVKKTTACPQGYYLFRMNLPHGTYVARFFGKPGFKFSTSNSLAV
jgi:hypothetical protein